MKKTVNYNLNKPEATDPMRLADFNQNADIIDTALGALAGRAKVVTGSYVGNNSGERTLELGFTPKFFLVVSNFSGRPFLTIATAGLGAVLTESGFYVDDSRCVEGGVYISSPGNDSANGNYYVAIQ